MEGSWGRLTTSSRSNSRMIPSTTNVPISNARGNAGMEYLPEGAVDCRKSLRRDVLPTDRYVRQGDDALRVDVHSAWDTPLRTAHGTRAAGKAATTHVTVRVRRLP